MIPGDLLVLSTETPPAGPAIYFLAWDDQVIYIGGSTRPAGRVEEHRLAGRVFDRALFLPTHADWIEAAELMWIARLHPRHNKAGNPLPDPRYKGWGVSTPDYPRPGVDLPGAFEAYAAGGVRELVAYRIRVAVEERKQTTQRT